jgi:DNA-binding response OmpR family regulator
MERILLVDDDDMLAAMIVDITARAGYEVFRAKDGAEALEAFDKSYDLVITDLIMPRTEGLELIRELRRLNADTPIIAMSGGGRNAPETYLPVAKLLGATVALSKPFSSQQLLAAIRSAVAPHH